MRVARRTCLCLRERSKQVGLLCGDATYWPTIAHALLSPSLSLFLTHSLMDLVRKNKDNTFIRKPLRSGCVCRASDVYGVLAQDEFLRRRNNAALCRCDLSRSAPWAPCAAHHEDGWRRDCVVGRQVMGDTLEDGGPPVFDSNSPGWSSPLALGLGHPEHFFLNRNKQKEIRTTKSLQGCSCKYWSPVLTWYSAARRFKAIGDKMTEASSSGSASGWILANIDWWIHCTWYLKQRIVAP